ncbi:hypothetical protein F5X71_00985 [Nocardia brasiliensis]|uniref:Uncharacterized protein n=1 Tax=Nocardia brasiliensis TaxID=37326 RepID=A0A6G9XJQ7_NOCBR|nr:hypothetical protein [Nocardia brasiliensis]QIS01090.1 hypothetical protein F5X71_00985 [Nocardia brasiliensis]
MTDAGPQARPAEPSGVLATVAGVLAIGIALFNLWGARTVLNAQLHQSPHIDNALAVFSLLGAVLAALALGYGALLLLRRDETGRHILVVTSGVLTVAALAALVVSLTGYQPDYALDWLPTQSRVFETVDALFGGLVGSMTALVHREWPAALAATALPLALFLLASARHTTNWVEHTPSRPAPRTEALDA